MEIIDIRNFRLEISKQPYQEFDVDIICDLLIKKGLVFREFGSCEEPYDKYFTYGYTNQDENGSCCWKKPFNNIHVKLNYNTSTRRKITYYTWMEVYKIDDYYYICCIAQHPIRKTSIGATSIVYKLKENEISECIDIIFKNVKFE